MPDRRIVAFACWCALVALVTGLAVLGAAATVGWAVGPIYWRSAWTCGPFDPDARPWPGWRWAYESNFATTQVRGILVNPPTSISDYAYPSAHERARAGTPRWSMATAVPPVESILGSEFTETAYGWPYLMFVRRTMFVPARPEKITWTTSVEQGPTETVWLFDGVAWNLGIGAIFTLLLPTVLLQLRLYSERQYARRFLCPKCGYDWQTLPQCPECGVQRG